MAAATAGCGRDGAADDMHAHITSMQETVNIEKREEIMAEREENKGGV